MYALKNLIFQKQISTNLLFEGGNSGRSRRLRTEVSAGRRQALGTPPGSGGLQTLKFKMFTLWSHRDVKGGTVIAPSVPETDLKTGLWDHKYRIRLLPRKLQRSKILR